jgi:hypothetical protein
MLLRRMQVISDHVDGHQLFPLPAATDARRR